MVSYSPNGSTTHLPSLQRSAARCPRGWSRQSSCSWNVFFSAISTDDDSTFPREPGLQLPNESLANSWPKVLFPFHGHFLFIRTEGDRRDSLLTGHRSEKHQQNKIRNGMRCNMTTKGKSPSTRQWPKKRLLGDFHDESFTKVMLISIYICL